jgi:hypothetical protein
MENGHEHGRRGAWREAAGLLAAVLGLFLIDAAIFRTRLYSPFLEPDATAGYLEMICYIEANRSPAGGKQVIAFGDSRLALTPELANQVSASRGYEFTNVGVAGSSPRIWYYMLRDLDPAARRYAVVLLPVDDYDDEDRSQQPADEIADLHYAIARLRLADVLEFSFSFPSWQRKWQALRGTLFKGVVYQADLHAFLLDPSDRRSRVTQSRRHAAAWRRDFLPPTSDMTGLAVDWAAWKIAFPPGTPPELRESMRSVLMRPVDPQTGRLAEYRRKWFGKIMELYRGTATRVVFYRLPRAPIPRPDSLVRKLSGSIREFRSRPNVILLDERTFDPLERPEFFQDALHLNREGVARFSKLMAERLLEALAAPPQASL